MAQERRGEELATPHGGGRHEQQLRETGGTGGETSCTDTAAVVVDECRNEMVDRVARYQFD